MIKSYEDLEVWQIGISLSKEIYKFTEQLPKEEIYGLTSQMRRAVVSISSNIAEGHQRHHRKEFIQFLYHSLGSLAELKTQLIITGKVYDIVCSKEVFELMDKLGRKLRKLTQVLSNPETRVSRHE
jgi:four helix bundle protein